MEDQDTLRSRKETPSSSPKQIVQVHSPVTSKMIPPKFDQNFNQHRPMLHKYTPDEVEIVYHRRTGTDEVVRTSERKRSKKNIGNGSLPSPTEVSKKGSSGELPLNDGTATSDIITDKSITCPQGKKKGPDCDLKPVDEPVEASVTAREVRCDMFRSENKSTNTEEVSCHAVSANEFLSLTAKISESTSDLNTRIQKLELLTQAMAADQILLRKLLVKHLRGNVAIATDMKKLQTLISNQGNSSLDQKAEEILQHVRLSSAKKGKVMNVKTSECPKPCNLATCHEETRNESGSTKVRPNS